MNFVRRDRTPEALQLQFAYRRSVERVFRGREDALADQDLPTSRNPTRVGGMMDVPYMDALMAAMQTEAGAEAMAYDGILLETLVVLVEA